jgi:hypothetical protein
MKKLPSRRWSSVAYLRLLERVSRISRTWRVLSCASSNIHTHTYIIRHNSNTNHHQRKLLHRRDNLGWGMECMSMPPRSELFRQERKTFISPPLPLPDGGGVPSATKRCGRASRSCIKRSSSSSKSRVGEGSERTGWVNET